jgi:hypothetical protein
VENDRGVLRLSVVLIVRDPKDDPERVLAALTGQARRAEAEVLLLEGRPNPRPCTGAGRPDRIIAAPGANMPRLKATGAEAARGEIVAFLEPKAAPEPGWLATVLDAFAARREQALGGPVLLAGPRRPADLAAYAFEYAAFAPARVAAGATRDLPGANMALPRAWLLDHCGDILARDGLNKPFCQERLRAAGLPIVLDPGMRVRLVTAHRLPRLLVSRFRYARCFGGTRIARAGPRRRLLYRLGAPAVPLLLLLRHLPELVQSEGPRPGAMAALAALCLAWAAGEATGSWLGRGRACEALF